MANTEIEVHRLDVTNDEDCDLKVTPEEVGAMFRTMRFDCVIVWLLGLLDALRTDWEEYEGYGAYPPADYIVRHLLAQEFGGDKET